MTEHPERLVARLTPPRKLVGASFAAGFLGCVIACAAALAILAIVSIG